MPDDGADGVVLEAGSTIGPHSAVSAGARIGAGATVGPASLVLGGDELPASTRWLGNPIAPWPVGRRRPDGAQRRARQTEKPAA
jgi:carbonic anhydrase/acetyltransferase-like protein (isoleucine patch superfamily)